jgi:hypothetical protein
VSGPFGDNFDSLVEWAGVAEKDKQSVYDAFLKVGWQPGNVASVFGRVRNDDGTEQKLPLFLFADRGLRPSAYVGLNGEIFRPEQVTVLHGERRPLSLIGVTGPEMWPLLETIDKEAGAKPLATTPFHLAFFPVKGEDGVVRGRFVVQLKNARNEDIFLGMDGKPIPKDRVSRSYVTIDQALGGAGVLGHEPVRAALRDVRTRLGGDASAALQLAAVQREDGAWEELALIRLTRWFHGTEYVSVVDGRHYTDDQVRFDYDYPK